MRKLWEEWMISTGLHEGKVNPPQPENTSPNGARIRVGTYLHRWWGMYSYHPPPPVQEEVELAAGTDDVNDAANNVHSSTDDDDTAVTDAYVNDENSSSGNDGSSDDNDDTSWDIQSPLKFYSRRWGDE